MEINAIVSDVVIAASTAGITWFFTRRKQNAEVKTSELDNVEKAILIWRGIAEDLGNKVEVLTQKSEVLTAKCEVLSVEIDGLRKENQSLKASLRQANNNYTATK